MEGTWDLSPAAFSKNVDELIKLIHEFGLTKAGLGNPEDSAYFSSFVAAVHEGWDLAQGAIFSGLASIESARKLAKNSPGASTTTREEVDRARAQLRFQEGTLRKLADSIAWQILSREPWAARRISDDEEAPTLCSKSAREVLRYTREHNKANPHAFALLTDLTSFVRAGDWLLVDRSDGGLNWRIAELKSGKLNHELLPLAQHGALSGCPHLVEGVRATRGDGIADQLGRMIRQIERLSRTEHLLRTDEGVDFRGDSVRLSKAVLQMASFRRELAESIRQSAERGWAIGGVDECVYFGAYRRQMRYGRAFETWMSMAGFEGLTVDLRQCVFAPLSRSFFVDPVVSVFCAEILRGDIVVMLHLVIDRFIDLLSQYSLNPKWLTPKQSRRARKEAPGQLFIWKGSALELSYGGSQMLVGNASLFRMLFDFERPSAVAELYGSNLVSLTKKGPK